MRGFYDEAKLPIMVEGDISTFCLTK